MHTREFPVLDETDRPLISRLAAGLGDDAARVLAYLLCREEIGTETGSESETDPATRLAVRIGTDLTRETVAAALGQLTDRDLLETTTLRTSARGRPPTAWRPAAGETETTRRVYASHGRRLIEQATTIADATGQNDSPSPSDGERSDDAPDRAASETLSLALNWEPNGLHAPFFAARARGAYERVGLSLAIETSRGSGAAIARVASGEADVALCGAATVLRARTDTPLVPIALVFQRAMATLYTTREAFGEPFERVGQLRGKRVGTSSESETGLLGRLFCSQAGVLDDVVLIDIAGEERTALANGHADVVTGSFGDPQQLRAAGARVDALVVSDQFPMYGPALVTTREILETRRTELEAFLAGTTAGWAIATEKPAEAVDAIPGLDDAERAREERTFEHAAREFGRSADVTAHGWGWQTATGWQRLETALGQVDLV